MVGAAARFTDEKLAQGSVSFTLTELCFAKKLSTIGARNQLLRLRPKVIRVAPKQEFYLIVSPEHRVMGAPPAAWWLDAYLSWLQIPYYLALQSAAAQYGSASQAVQVVQVITDRPRRSLTVGRIRVRFFVKKNIRKTPTGYLSNSYAPLMASTPEATALDLVRYASRIGGIERAAETLKPILRLFKRRSLRTAAEADSEAATCQRLGYILDKAGYKTLATAAVQHLALLRLPLAALAQGVDTSASKINLKWRIIVNANIGTGS